jgi:hypothetical protein
VCLCIYVHFSSVIPQYSTDASSGTLDQANQGTGRDEVLSSDLSPSSFGATVGGAVGGVVVGMLLFVVLVVMVVGIIYHSKRKGVPKGKQQTAAMDKAGYREGTYYCIKCC